MADIIDHPTNDSFWRHDPPMWKPCSVCGHPTCWVEMDIAFMHPECDMYPAGEDDPAEIGKTVRIILGKRIVE